MKNIHVTNENTYITIDEEIKEGDWVVEINTSPRTPYIGKTFYPKNDGTVTEEDLKKHLLSVNYKDHYETIAHKGNCSKIILTDNEDLIKDGVQAIDDEFLEWFVNNPNCEFVEVEESTLLNTSRTFLGVEKYKIIIPSEEALYDYGWCKGNVMLPKEELKQETLEEARRKYVSDINCELYNEQIVDTIKAFSSDAFEQGYYLAQQQNNNLYSEEDIQQLRQLFKDRFDCYADSDEVVMAVTENTFIKIILEFEQFKKK